MESIKLTVNDTETNSAVWIQRSQEGDLESFGELIRLYREKAYGLAYSYLRNHQDAEDVSQEAFLKVYKNIRSFQNSGSFKAWLLKIVANLAKNKLRWRKIRAKFTVSLDEPVNVSDKSDGDRMQVQDPDKRIDPVFNLMESQAAQQVNQAMEHLSAQQRLVIHLKFIEGYKISEIANILKLAEGTVKTHIFRGLEGLKKLIQVEM